jgi:methionine biosynthesis protein MetW
MGGRAAIKRRPDYDLIARLVPEGARVLDLGCGDGQLLADLMRLKGCQGYGIEIDEARVIECINRGVPVYHGDMMEGLSHYRDQTFELVILSQTLQQTQNPRLVAHEMLRVGHSAIISFPNFGQWRLAMQLLFGGHMPENELLPYRWYDTPNVHLCTVRDWTDLCQQEGMRIDNEVFVVPPDRQIRPFLVNLRAGLAIFQISRGPDYVAPFASEA